MIRIEPVEGLEKGCVCIACKNREVDLVIVFGSRSGNTASVRVQLCAYCLYELGGMVMDPEVFKNR